MLTIEQFQNPQMAALQTKQNYTDVMGYFTGLVRFLIRQGRLVDSDPEIMAAAALSADLLPGSISATGSRSGRMM
ncbi:MAG: hypothetical protein ACLR5H_11195 [Oscillospiraceae bacterium]